MFPGKSIPKVLFFNMILFTTISCIVIGFLWISGEYERFHIKTSIMRDEFVASRKSLIKQQVDDAVDFVEFKRRQADQRIHRMLKERVYTAHGIASHLYERYKDSKSLSDIQEMVCEALRPVRFNDNRGYYFATRLDGVEQLSADRPDLEGKNLLDMQDTQGAYVIRDMIDLAREEGEGYYSYTWTRPESDKKDHLKLSFIKYFAPFDWFIGTGEYVEDLDQDLQREALDWIENIRYGDSGYVFVGQWDGLSLSGPAVGTNMFDATDVNGVKIVQELIERAKGDGGFVDYVMLKIDGQKPAPKISYAKGIKQWQWYIGTGLYVDQIENVIADLHDEMLAELRWNVGEICIVLGLLWLGASFVVARVAGTVRAAFNAFAVFFEKASTGLSEASVEGMSFLEFDRLALSANRMISRRREAEKALYESQERFRAAFDSAQDCVLIWDKEYNYLYANQAAIDHVGVTADKVVGKNIRDGLGHVPDFMHLWMRRVDKVFETGETLRVQDDREIQGRLCHTDSIITPICDPDGTVASVCVVYRDITELRLAENELRRLRNYLSSIIDSMPSLLIGVDEEGKVTQWNKEAERVTGVVAEEAVGQPLAQAFPFLASKMAWVREAMQKQEVRSESKQACIENGETRYEDVTIYPLISNGVGGAVIRVDDVTEKARIEEMIVQSEKMLSVGGLAAGMAHEINNPLAGMMQNASVIADRLSNLKLTANRRAAQEAGTTIEAIGAFMESRKILHMLDCICKSGAHAAEIVSNMLSFSRKSASSFSPCNLTELLDRCVELAGADYSLKRKYDFRQIEIVREYEEHLPLVRCDSVKIQQVLLNILRNGAEAMQESQALRKGKNELKNRRKMRFILRAAQEQETGMVRIEIQDNGTGMDENTRKRIFEPFFTTKPPDQGTGLGLSVSYFIIKENHKGELNVESTLAEGSTFSIKLPIR